MGPLLGDMLGHTDGIEDGSLEGICDRVGLMLREGALVGNDDGCWLGELLGRRDGMAVKEGPALGSKEG